MALQIHYTKTHFSLTMLHNTTLSSNKVSALRGGLGTMLLHSNCISDKQCDSCFFSDECLVQRIMYSKFDIKPAYITTGESVGYILECENHKRNFQKGDLLEFDLILFGKSIIHFSQLLQALFSLGQSGLGANKAHFSISDIQNETGKNILCNGNIIMSNYQPHMLQSYVEHRLTEFPYASELSNVSLIFHSPTTIKYQGNIQQSFHIEAILNSIARRIEMLNYYEGKPISGKELIHNIPNVIKQSSYAEEVNRYSSRHKENIKLHGITGDLLLSNVDFETLSLLLAGELIHIGKNTSFGFGRYTVVPQ